eukprot:13515945-Alexandrium_andersonii.AAC.1
MRDALPHDVGQGPPGYKKNDVWGAELIAQDGTLPFRVALRCLAHRRGLFVEEGGAHQQAVPLHA